MKVAIKNSDFKYGGERLKEGREYDLDDAALAAIGEDNYEAVTDAKAEASEKPDPNKGLRTKTGKDEGNSPAGDQTPPEDGEGKGEGDPAPGEGEGGEGAGAPADEGDGKGKEAAKDKTKKGGKK